MQNDRGYLLKYYGALIIYLFCTFFPKDSKAQVAPSPGMFRIYEDNDFLNIRGNGTDNSYTNGTSLDYFYTKNKPSRFFIDRWMPKAGSGSINIYSWRLTQLMVSPNDISKPDFQPDDYPYAGILYTLHSLYSYDAVKKYSFMTELILGIRGPASFARQTQEYVHALIHYQKPMGWANQLNTSPLINLNFTVEKQLFSIGNFAELIGGAEISAGSYLDQLGIYPMLRIGKMAPYFDGLLSQFGSYSPNKRKIKTQFYLVARPKSTWVLHNALMHGQRVNQDNLPPNTAEPLTLRRIRHRIADIQFGAVLVHGRCSISYLQTHSTEYNTGLYRHNFGNISFYLGW